ncbi:Ribonuclease T2-like protein [Aduncisulcus paluster]|uniref:Ribonuclease T2-like protein n=1 Tax=Aduncisulcus paluster TaxID=2918883 RepID=A0ABQ5KJY1_9EUKA|nr:Ribonuclease T2-like protein [Aduncisulcus paluster]
MKTSFILAIVAALTIGVVYADFDFYLFETFWPETLCGMSERGSSCWLNPCTDSFTVHGLWPNNTDGSYPSSCGGSSWDMNLVQDLYNELIYKWPDYNSSEGKDGCDSNRNSFLEAKTYHSVDYLWEHEYTKHGTCAIKYEPDTFSDEHDYMSEALYLLDMLDFQGALNQLGYEQGAEGMVYDDLMNQLAGYYGVTVSVKCQSSIIFGINACFDLNLGLMDCPSNVVGEDKSTCKKHADALAWPTIKYE